MTPTHQYTDARGHVYRGVVLGPAGYNGVWFLPLCDDGITWMAIPVWTTGVIRLQETT